MRALHTHMKRGGKKRGRQGRTRSRGIARLGPPPAHRPCRSRLPRARAIPSSGRGHGRTPPTFGRSPARRHFRDAQGAKRSSRAHAYVTCLLLQIKSDPPPYRHTTRKERGEKRGEEREKKRETGRHPPTGGRKRVAPHRQRERTRARFPLFPLSSSPPSARSAIQRRQQQQQRQQRQHVARADPAGEPRLYQSSDP